MAIQNRLYVLSTVVIFLSIWSVVTHFNLISPFFLPAPQDIIRGAWELLEKKYILDISMTTYRVMCAFLLSFFISIPIAFSIFLFPLLRTICIPYIDFLKYVPVPALIPLTILFIGIDEGAKIFLLFFGTVFQLILLFVADFDRIPKEYFELGYSLHFSLKQKIYMIWKAALPDLYTNARISLALCWSYVLIAELIATESGIGHMIKEAQRFSITAQVFVGILTITMIGHMSDLILKRLYIWFFPYIIHDQST